MWWDSYSWGYSHVLWKICPQMLRISLISSLRWVHWGFRSHSLYCVWRVASTFYIVAHQLVLFCFHYSGYRYKSIEHQSINMFTCSPMHWAGSLLSFEGNTWKIGHKLPGFTFTTLRISDTEHVSHCLTFQSFEEKKKMCVLWALGVWDGDDSHLLPHQIVA